MVMMIVKHQQTEAGKSLYAGDLQRRLNEMILFP